MEFNADQLIEIENFAYLYLEKKEIAIVTGITDLSLFDNPDTAIYIAFWKGRLRRKAKFNQNVIQLSDQLSSPAQNIEAKLANDVHLNDKKR